MESQSQNPIAEFSLRAATFAPYILVGLVVLTATMYASPQTDDFCTFGRLFSQSNGNPLRETWYLYEHWTGRYTSSFIVAVVGWLIAVIPASVHAVYSVCLAAIAALFAWSCVLVTRVLSASRQPNLLLAAIIFASSMALTPSKLEAYLWLTGAAVYFVGLAVFFVVISMLARRQATPATGVSPPFDWPALMAIAVCVGFNEFLAIALFGYLALTAALAVKEGARLSRNIGYLAVCLVAFMASVFAPGNFARDSSISVVRHDIASATSLSMKSFGLFVDAMLLPHGVLLVALLAAAACAGWLLRREPSKVSSVAPLVTVLTLAFPMHLWVYSFLTGEETPGRIINQAFVMALVGLCLLCAWLGQQVSRRRSDGPRAALSVVVLMVGLMLISSSPFTRFAQATRDYAPIWRYQHIERHRQLLAASHSGAPATVRPFASGDSAPPTFRGGDVSADSTNWINRCVAAYYSIPSVRLALP
jgi:hypothetical protein